MDNVYLIVKEEKDKSGNTTEVFSFHNIIFDETDSMLHLYSHDKNCVRWRGYPRDIDLAKSAIEKDLCELERMNIIKEWRFMGSVNL